MAAAPAPDRFVVGGLGGLGQHGLVVLREFGVTVSAVDRAPPDDLRLEPGDGLVVLATSTSLQRVESGRRFPRRYGVAFEGTLTPDAVLGGAAELSRRTGASIAEARAFMDAGPGVFSRPLHHRQAVDLVRSLERHQVRAAVVAMPRSRAEASATVSPNDDVHEPIDSEPDAEAGAERVSGRL